jgi:hypothetical protein
MLCMQCGFLQDPPTAGYRTDGAAAFPDACRACKATMWLDLQRAEALAMLEHDEALHAGGRESALARWGGWAATTLSIFLVGGGIFAGGAYVLLRFLGENLLVPAGLTALVLGMALTVIVKKIGGALTLPIARERPARWRLALPAGRPPKVPRGQTPVPAGDLLIAPLSGRACVAYEVGIREDGDRDADAGSWLFLEQRVTTLSVGGTTLPGETISLDVADRRAPAELAEDNHARWGRFLRERGFTGHEAVTVYETIVGPGAPLVVSRRRTGLVLGVARTGG